MNKIKEILLSILVVFLFILFMFEKCNNGKYIQQKPDTTYISDTIKIKVQGATIFKPIPYKVEVPHDTTIYIKDTSLQGYKDAYFKAQYQLLTKNYYNDTLFVNDSTGLNGYVAFKDTVYKNKLIGKGTYHKMDFPKITNTVTITKYPEKKTLWFVGGGIIGNEIKYVNGMEINGGFLNKKNQFYEIGYQKWGNENIYKLGFKIKL